MFCTQLKIQRNEMSPFIAEGGIFLCLKGILRHYRIITTVLRNRVAEDSDYVKK
jgi:hypothetical protein